MPTAALHPCSWPGGCRALTAGRLCAAHAPAASDTAAPVGYRWGTERRDVKRLRGRQLQARREALFAREPLCRRCRELGRVTVATIRDHVVPLAEGGRDDETNVQALCQECSDSKTREESKRGQQRAGLAR